MKIKVQGKFEKASGGEEAYVIINKTTGLFSVKPLYGREVYELPISKVAEMVVVKLIKLKNLEG